ncbi:MAG: aminoacyl-tRNA hydrolase [Burkholderiales bacterium]|nr:aminoacyl-tRNA hydrolase [Burkholderiales bacterium]
MISMMVGLGNPGPEYEQTRHNAGFWWADAVARQIKASWVIDKNHQALVARTAVNGQTLWLLKPQTFMNLSGRSVAGLARFYKIEPAAILVAHDELDIAAGEARLKFGGGHAGHNGLRDIHAQLGSGDYWRLRLGIGRPDERADVLNWVLKKPPLEQRIAVEQAVERGLTALPALLAGDTAQATLLVHTSKPQRPKPVRSAPPLL